MQSLLESKISELLELEDALLQLTMACLNAHGAALYPLDLMASAAAKRSLSLALGFRRMVEDRNMMCAGALLRLQLDTALRFYAAYRAKDPHKFAVAVLDGGEIRKMKDRFGKKMTDRYLVDTLMAESEENQWIGSVYRETSGYVHFSVKHMVSIFFPSLEHDGKFQMKIHARDNDMSDEAFLEATSAFIEALSLFMKYLHGWGMTKENPHLVERLKSDWSGEESGSLNNSLADGNQDESLD